MEEMAFFLSLVEISFAAVAGVLVYMTWRVRDKPAGRPLFVFSVAAVLYTVASVLTTVIVRPVLWNLVNNVRYPLGATLAVAFFYVAVTFAHRGTFKNRTIAVLFGTFLFVDFVAAVTDPFHNTVIASQSVTESGVIVGTAGPMFWVHTISSLSIAFASLALLLMTYLETEGRYRKQSAVLISAILIAIVFFVWQSVAPVHPAFDLATVGIVGWSGIMFWGLFRTQFLDTVPLARRTLMEGMDDPVVVLDDDDRVRDLNASARELFKIDEDVFGTSVYDSFDAHSDFLGAVEGDDETELVFEDDGRERCYDATVSPILPEEADGETNALGRVVHLRDITRQRKHERRIERHRRRYQAFAEHVSDILSVVDGDGTMRYQSPSIQPALGYEPHELVGEDVFEYIHPDDEEMALKIFEETVGASEPVTNRSEYRFRHADGSWVWIETLATNNQHPTLDGYINSSRVITTRKEYEQELERATERLERKNQQLERLAQVISHDLKTPLSTAEKTVARLEHEIQEGDDVERTLEDLRTTHERLRDFTEHLPRLARESVSVQDPVDCSLRDVATEAWEVVDTGVLSLKVEDDKTLEGDRRRLRQMFENLFTNTVEHAVDNTPSSSSASTVRVGTDAAGFYVADDGPGVEAGEDDEIFRYGMCTGDGSGVGLAIVRTIVESHGWSITVEESESGGACFVVTTDESA